MQRTEGRVSALVIDNFAWLNSLYLITWFQMASWISRLMYLLSWMFLCPVLLIDETLYCELFTMLMRKSYVRTMIWWVNGAERNESICVSTVTDWLWIVTIGISDVEKWIYFIDTRIVCRTIITKINIDIFCNVKLCCIYSIVWGHVQSYNQ